MKITLQAFLLSNTSDDSKPILVPSILFGIKPVLIPILTTVEHLQNEVLNFQNVVLKHLENQDKRLLDSANAKFQVCVEFYYNEITKNHSISIPLTLFMGYSEHELEDVSQHLFLELFKKWSTFYKESKK